MGVVQAGCHNNIHPCFDLGFHVGRCVNTGVGKVSSLAITLTRNDLIEAAKEKASLMGISKNEGLTWEYGPGEPEVIDITVHDELTVLVKFEIEEVSDA